MNCYQATPFKTQHGQELLLGHVCWRLHYVKWARQDSNLRPTGYEPAALTTELRARIVLQMEERATGIEPVPSAWKAETLPLCNARVFYDRLIYLLPIDIIA
jgi:hypothetical protein